MPITWDCQRIDVDMYWGETETWDHIDPELLGIIRWLVWSAPLLLSVVYASFAVAVALRGSVQKAYAKGIKERLEFQKMQKQIQRRMTLTGTQQKTKAELEQDELFNKLLHIVRVVICCFVMLASAAWMSAAVAGARIQASGTAMGFLFLAFCALLLFFYVTLKSVITKLMQQVCEHPLLRSMSGGLRSSDWASALLIVMFGFFAPMVLLLSAMNQKVRNWRGIRDSEDAEDDEENGIDAWLRGVSRQTTRDSINKMYAARSLTYRVRRQLVRMQEWRWASVAPKVHYVCIIFVLLQVVVSKFTTITLAWVNSLLSTLPFAHLCFLFYLVGLFMFALPPVPGPPVYLLGGVLIPENRPEDWSFFGASAFACFMGFFLKMSAIYVQQKWIGEQLSRNDTVRQIVGVNKPLMRGIELVLRRPGLSPGKVAILCGGPDWPTSVLTGVLKLSLGCVCIVESHRLYQILCSTLCS